MPQSTDLERRQGTCLLTAASRLCRHDTWGGGPDIEDIIELLQCAHPLCSAHLRRHLTHQHTGCIISHLNNKDNDNKQRNKIRKNPTKNNYFQTHIITIIMEMQNYETLLQKTQSHLQWIITIKIIGSAVSLCSVELCNFDIDSHRWEYSISLTLMYIDTQYY